MLIREPKAKDTKAITGMYYQLYPHFKGTKKSKGLWLFTDEI